VRVAIDARELCGKPTGVGRYLSELLAEWSRSPDARRHAWTLYAPAAPPLPEGTIGRIAVVPGPGGTSWEQWTLTRALVADRPDVLFAPGYSAPLTAPCATVVAIHDVSFAARPEWFARREGTRRRLITGWSARRARRILTISEFSKREIVARLGVPANRVVVTPLGVRGGTGSRTQAKDPLVLYVGSIFERRHVDVLIQAFVAHVAPALPRAELHIVGENRMSGGATPEAALSGAPADVRARVHLRSYVDEPTLADLYARAMAFVFLSEYEGFGLTPVEAMAHGAAPVVLDTEVAREVYGAAAEYLSLGPTLAADLGRSLVALLSDAGARARLVAEGPAVLSRYDWSRTAAQTLAALEDAVLAR
jgi:glycosyltransferase involved in cell wall biosynthesis